MTEALNISNIIKREKSDVSILSNDSRNWSPDRRLNSSTMKENINHYKTTDDAYNDGGIKNSISVQDIVRSRSRKNHLFGIEGYWIPKFNAYLDKPNVRKWVNNTLPDFYSEIKKRAQMTPSPDHYQK